MAIAFIVLVFFIFAGQLLLQALHIPMTSFQLAGSIVRPGQPVDGPGGSNPGESAFDSSESIT